ncbi:MAG: DUF4038 domain-containing protein [Chitinivibrionales bacterium]|nr:DUF4038 domain-containing protein [Chitinivibrionales bacterium]
MATLTVPLHQPHDFTLASDAAHDNPFMVAVHATFTHETGLAIENVPAFYAGGKRWIVRFSPTLPGAWNGRTRSDDASLNDIPLDDVACVPNDNGRVHGLLGIDEARPRKLAWSDGTPFVLLGFECDWLFEYHRRDPKRAATHIDLLRERGFNYIVTNVYAHTGFSGPDPSGKDIRQVKPEYIYGPPEEYVFGGSNEQPDHSRLNTKFFEHFDAMMRALHERGIVAHLMIQVQNKAVTWPPRRSPEDDLFWRYVVARYQAFGNVVWDLSKESYNLVKETGGFDYLLDRIELIRRCDAYGHLVTAHDVLQGSMVRDTVVDDACDIVSDQIHLGDCRRYNREASRRLQRREKPYLNVEYGYEIGVEDLRTYTGHTTADWQQVLLWTWSVYAAGAYPCYYYNNTSWDLISFEPEPPGWKRYEYLHAFLCETPFNDMESANDLTQRGMCLADPGKAYLVFLPEGGGTELDLSDVADKSRMQCEWMAVYTGDRLSTEAETNGFVTGLENPFESPDQPCVVRVTVAS